MPLVKQWSSNFHDKEAIPGGTGDNSHLAAKLETLEIRHFECVCVL